ncbi:MAG: hypothetical protein MR531_16825 [Lachnospiraceae bacterium]|nr:hypothetical protein [Lachnospiraceae bacterium]
MATMNRLYQLHIERKAATLLKGYEWSFDSMRSFKAKHKRENCVLEIVANPGK